MRTEDYVTWYPGKQGTTIHETPCSSLKKNIEREGIITHMFKKTCLETSE